MRYFIVNLAVHLAVTAVFVIFTCVCAGRNRRKKTKHIVSYFFPIAFALIAILDIVIYTAPRLMDINSMINSNYYYNTGKVEKISFMNNYFVVDKNYYFINPLRNKLKEGEVVRVKHTPYSFFTVDVSTVSETQESGDSSSAKETQ